MTVSVRRTATSVLAALLAVCTVLVPSQGAVAAAPVVSGSETDLGVQIPARTGTVRSEQSAQGRLPDGRYLAYFATNGGSGAKARFFAMDMSGRTVTTLEIPAGTQVHSLVYSAARKSVFVAASSSTAGYLYEWSGSGLTRRAAISKHQIMRLAAASDGTVYIGTYAPSNGRLYRWRSGTLVDMGQPMAKESYVRSLAVDSSSVWVSNYRDGAAKLVRVTRATNVRRAVTVPATFSSQWGAMDMSRAGSYLFLRTVSSPRLFAFRVDTGRFVSLDDQVRRVNGATERRNAVPYIDGISPYGISPLVAGRYVYFQRAGAGIMRIDLQSNLKTVRVDKYHSVDNRTSWPSASVAGPVSYAWMPDVAGRNGYSLVTTTIDGKVVVNTPSQSRPATYALSARGTPAQIIRLGTDAAGHVYSGGFNLPAGVGRYVPSSGATTVIPGPQMEGLGRYSSAMVMGGYTGSSTDSAPIYVYSASTGLTRKTYLRNKQERPVAIQQVGTRVAIGSVPIKNTLGGALSLWNPATNSLTVKRNIIANHSVVSLGTYNGLVVGGSSNAGGTGSTPASTSARLFTYNVGTGAVRTLVPPRAASATYSSVSAITPEPGNPGYFWAISTGYLIRFKVGTSGTLAISRNLGPLPNTGSATGKELGLAFLGSTLYVTADQGLHAVNRSTGERRLVAGKTAAGPVVGLVKGADGALYYARGSRLYRFGPTSS